MWMTVSASRDTDWRQASPSYSRFNPVDVLYTHDAIHNDIPWLSSKLVFANGKYSHHMYFGIQFESLDGDLKTEIQHLLKRDSIVKLLDQNFKILVHWDLYRSSESFDAKSQFKQPYPMTKDPLVL
jgi:hypothetical protein